VIGGGPAGSSLALRLAALGRRVILFEKDDFPRCHVGESLTGGILPLLDVLAVRPAIESAGFLPAAQATVFWAGQLHRRETHGGYQVDRGKFDALLLHAARRAGVDVRQPARVVHSTHRGHWTLTLESGETFEALFVADGAGRSRFLPGIKSCVGARSLAMYSYWFDVDPLEGDTLVEAGASHWYWGAPLPGGLFNATVFVEPSCTRLDSYLALIRQSKLMAKRIGHGRCGNIRACAATPFLDECPVSDRFIKVGEAAISIDALSSQGVQTAIGTALHAAVVINTMIDRPGDTPLAIDFYRQRLSDSSKFHARSARMLYREQLAVTETDFWRKRAGEEIDHRPEEKKPLMPDDRIQLSDRVLFVPVPVVNDRYVVQADGVKWSGKTSVYIGGASVSGLLGEINKSMRAQELLKRWRRVIPDGAALKVIQWAWSEGLIERIP
jgi:flavin-dependent dehydrogenase